MRVQQRLADIVVLLDQLRLEFQGEAADEIRWVERDVEEIAGRIEPLLDRLAS